MKFNIIVLFSLFLIPAVAFGQSDAGCITAKCHTTIAVGEFVHGPVGARICSVCHNPVEGKKHEFTFPSEQEELCFSCHEDSRDMMLQESLHTPVSDGNCVGCHDPHATDYRFSLKGNAADLCFQCHDKEEFNKAYVHGPVGVGDCNVCHSPHASEHEQQLMSSKEELCFVCHKEQVGMLDKRHVHPPVDESCDNCHNPHSNDAKYMLEKDTPELCYDCHSEYLEFKHVEYKHQPVENGDCGACHNVHSSDHPRMFPKEQGGLCLSCHEDMNEYVSEQTHLHGPVKEGDCNACHNPHGSNNFRTLRKNFPEEFYMPYETDNYAVCFECHNKNIALDAKTTSMTDFRDGDVNLHYLHVNKDVKGRSCKACHQVHASSQEKHVRESVPFGGMNWELPVNYTKLPDGGKCVVGCHAPKEYLRK